MNNAITEIKNTLEGTNRRVTEAEDRISEIEDRMVEINETEEKRKTKEMRTISETSGTMLNAPTFESQESQKKKTKIKAMRQILEEIIVEIFSKMGEGNNHPSPRNPESPKQDGVSFSTSVLPMNIQD